MVRLKKRKIQLEPLEAIKRLLVLQLLASGVSDKAIAKVLDIDASTVRHLVSLKEIKTSNKSHE
jgi:DNA-binding NarL/FixJ family response regulator